MKCNDAEKLILLQDSGEMTGKRTHALAAHLHDCEACRGFQHALIESQDIFHSMAEPGEKVMQNILREARLNAPEPAQAKVFYWKPALAMAASVMIGLGIFFAAFSSDKVGMELIVSETDLLDTSDQIVSVMYSGLSEDDLAFNFLMTYENGAEG
jgi:anti-sigma factor RsiW